MTTDKSSEREAFEAWAATVMLNLKRLYAGYFHEATAFAWLAWEARAALPQQAQEALLPPQGADDGGFGPIWRALVRLGVGWEGRQEVQRLWADSIAKAFAASPAPGELGAVDASVRKNVHGDIARPDLDKHAYEHHWQRPDGTVYAVDSSD